MQQSVLDFFNLEKPCPDNIPNCMDLRKQYLDDVQTLGSTGCSKCAINRIKSKFINIIISTTSQNA